MQKTTHGLGVARYNSCTRGRAWRAFQCGDPFIEARERVGVLLGKGREPLELQFDRVEPGEDIGDRAGRGPLGLPGRGLFVGGDLRLEKAPFAAGKDIALERPDLRLDLAQPGLVAGILCKGRCGRGGEHRPRSERAEQASRKKGAGGECPGRFHHGLHNIPFSAVNFFGLVVRSSREGAAQRHGACLDKRA